MNKKGFTLVELIVVVTVIGILIGGVALSLTGHARTARDQRRRTDIQQIKSALEFYRGDQLNGNYPTATSQLVSGGYLEEVPLDPLTDGTYPYFPVSAANGACDNATTFCVNYSLRSTLEDGSTYTVTPLSTN